MTSFKLMNLPPNVLDAGHPREFRADPPQPGEIYAWRAWVVDAAVPALHSTVVLAKWASDEPMVAKPEPYPAVNPYLMCLPNIGIHAWKTRALVHRYANEFGPCTLAIGRVKLWGDIFEHKLGYRAEFARVHALHEVRGNRGNPGTRGGNYLALLRRLQLRYGLWENDDHHDA